MARTEFSYRVLTSRSIETLVMQLVLSVGALLFMAYLDVIRSRLLTAAAAPGNEFDDIVIWMGKYTLFQRMVPAGKLP